MAPTVLARNRITSMTVMLVAVLLGHFPILPLRAQTASELGQKARIDSNDAQLNYQAARAYWAEKNWDEAERFLREAVTVAPQYAEALLALGSLPAARGEKYWKRVEEEKGSGAADSLLATYQQFQMRAFIMNPLVDLSIRGKMDVGAMLGLGRSYGAVMRIWWMRPWQRAATMLHEGDAAGAFALMDSITHVRYFADPNDIPDVILIYHGLSAARVKNWDPAIQDFAMLTGRAVQEEKAAAEADRPVRAAVANFFRYQLGTMLYLAGRHHQAAPVFRRVLEIQPGMYPAHVQLARMMEADGDWAGALAEREAAVASSPGDGTLQMELAMALVHAQRTLEAIDVLNDGAIASPRDYRIPLMQAEMLVAAGRPQAARAPYERFLALAPSRLTPEITRARQALSQAQ